MPAAKLDSKAIFANLNELRKAGVLLTDPFKIASLNKAADAIKSYKNGQPASMDSTGMYFFILASLRCLMGNFEQVIELGNKALNLIKAPQLIMYHVNTLIVAGFFSQARKLLILCIMAS